jgi:sigma-E factor negative regulatory protein RseA
MTQDQKPDQKHDAHRQRISSFVDGEAEAVVAHSLASAWRDDPALRRTWHSYHLIGDVLRSDELAIDPSRDEHFLQRLRERMASEPVVLAPTLPRPSLPLQEDVRTPARAAAGFAATRSRRRRWQAPAAMAAGVVAVAGVAVMMRGGDPAAGSAATVLAGSASSPITVVAMPAPEPVAVANSLTHRSIIRDPRIDSYFQAHRQFSLGGPLGIPAGYMRNDEPAVLPPQPQPQPQQQR